MKAQGFVSDDPIQTVDQETTLIRHRLISETDRLLDMREILRDLRPEVSLQGIHPEETHPTIHREVLHVLSREEHQEVIRRGGHHPLQDDSLEAREVAIRRIHHQEEEEVQEDTAHPTTTMMMTTRAAAMRINQDSIRRSCIPNAKIRFAMQREQPVLLFTRGTPRLILRGDMGKSR